MERPIPPSSSRSQQKAISGRLALMILTTAKPQQLIEQPVKVTVEDGTAQR
ncbi:MAG: hypothetical protein WDO73_00935 [Ignavibacteriota bacterium]